jgi:hypothetical protein
MRARITIALIGIVGVVALGCHDSPITDVAYPVYCASVGIPSVLVEVRDPAGRPNAVGASVSIVNQNGFSADARGYGDPLRISVWKSGQNVGGVFTVTVTKPWHQSATVSGVLTPERPCGTTEPGRAWVVIGLLPGAPAVRQVIAEGNVGFGWGNMTGFLNAKVEADSNASHELRWLSRDTTVVTLTSAGAYRTKCRRSYGETWAVAASAVNPSLRDSLIVGVFADSSPEHCPRP